MGDLGVAPQHNHGNFIYNTSPEGEEGTAGGGGGGQCRAGGTLLLLSSPDDDHATGVAGGQQTLVAVEADVEHRCTVALQLVHSSLGRPLHVKEVNTHILTACHCPDKRERGSGAWWGVLEVVGGGRASRSLG